MSSEVSYRYWSRRQILLGGSGGCLWLESEAPLAHQGRMPPRLIPRDRTSCGSWPMTWVSPTQLHGQRAFATPHIDRIAREGLFLRQSYSNSAVCSATRTGLITGCYQYRLRVGLEEPLAAPSDVLGLAPSHPTLPSLLRRHGHRTTLVGKWHLGISSAFGPLQSGYESFYGIHPGAGRLLPSFTDRQRGRSQCAAGRQCALL